MRTYQISLGDTLDHGGIDYGQVAAETPTEAVCEALRDGDRTREYEATELSRSVDYGRGSRGRCEDGSGNGAQDRTAWVYVTDVVSGQFVGLYTVREAVQGE